MKSGTILPGTALAFLVVFSAFCVWLGRPQPAASIVAREPASYDASLKLANKMDYEREGEFLWLQTRLSVMQRQELDRQRFDLILRLPPR